MSIPPYDPTFQTTDSDMAGETWTDRDGKTYKVCYFASAISDADGRIVAYNGTNGYNVAAATTVADPRLAGVISTGVTAITSGQYVPVVVAAAAQNVQIESGTCAAGSVATNGTGSQAIELSGSTAVTGGLLSGAPDMVSHKALGVFLEAQTGAATGGSAYKAVCIRGLI